MKERKVEIPVDYQVREMLKVGKGNLTWDVYLTYLKQQYEKDTKNGLRFGKK